jgi:hypothetical protein
MAILLPNIKTANNKKYILCAVRKKYILLTPEEKVRQYTLHVLVNEYQFPLKYISVEKTLRVNELKKRYDIVVFNRALNPKILIECKAEYISIKENTLQQIATYNIKLQVPYLMVTNGNNHFYFQIKDETSVQINNLPLYEEL